MPDLYIKQGGSWTPITNCHVKQGGSWSEVQKVYIKDAGSWKEVWANFVVTVSGGTVAPVTGFGGPQTCGVEVRSDGTIWDNRNDVHTQLSSSTDWIIPNSASAGSFWVRFTTVSGDATNGTDHGTALNSWTALSSTQSRFMIDTVSGGIGLTGVLRVEISSDSSGSPLLDSGDYTLTANWT